ncbi:MAG: hypothetical protein C4519_03790 [Desulfobacteraceae bacterium]|nr:MAG: hypothetical protein C4519_03790 [Desulfobacteraceae bacterium]
MKRPTWLISLLEKGAVAHSAADRRIVDELLTLGIIGLKSTGLRQTVSAIDPAQLRLWVEARYPLPAIDPDTLPSRVGNIVRSGSSKTGHSSHAVLPLHFKWFGHGPLARMTSAYGMMAVLTDRVPHLPVPDRWRLLTIENWEPFHRSDYAGAPIPVMAVYLGGNVSDTVIEALKGFRNPPEAVLHFGDYDWDGLYIFQRLNTALPSARLYVPPDIEALFAQFGSRRLLERQKRKTGLDPAGPECRRIITQIEQHNAGLEQEIVALPPTI